jgi:Lrp/AsnC family transcriptional regulator
MSGARNADRTLDEADMRILRVLQKEPTLTVAELGERVGLSHTPCWRRVKQMEEAGVIQGRAVVLDPDALGFEVSVFCLVRLKQHDEETLNAFEDAARRLPEILQCYSLAGEHDYVLRVLVRSVRDYEQVVKVSLLHLPHVNHVQSNFALREVKNTSALPI